MSADDDVEPPPLCAECGRAWVFREPWWREPALIPVWGYLVHCEGGHFAWFPGELSDEEKAAAERRFVGLGD